MKSEEFQRILFASFLQSSLRSLGMFRNLPSASLDRVVGKIFNTNQHVPFRVVRAWLSRSTEFGGGRHRRLFSRTNKKTATLNDQTSNHDRIRGISLTESESRFEPGLVVWIAVQVGKCGVRMPMKVNYCVRTLFSSCRRRKISTSEGQRRTWERRTFAGRKAGRLAGWLATLSDKYKDSPVHRVGGIQTVFAEVESSVSSLNDAPERSSASAAAAAATATADDSR